MVRGVIFVVLGVLAASCQPQAHYPIMTGPDVDTIRATEAQLGDAFERRDAAAAASFYDTTASITQPLRSTEHCMVVKTCYDNMFADPNGSITMSIDNIEVATSHDLAVSSGECIVFSTSPRTHQRASYAGNCMRSWRRDAQGHWKIGWETRTPLMNRDEDLD